MGLNFDLEVVGKPYIFCIFLLNGQPTYDVFRAVLENLIDREKETREKWESLKETVAGWKNDIYNRMEKANKLDENVKILNDLMDTATNDELLAGDVFAREIEQAISSNGKVPSRKYILYLSPLISFNIQTL